ncbi:MAG TPA: zinc ribbon domain-containing protein [Terriglobales bacterium]|jgi:hypothetical protein|nr:zinc ribbon domain-containing protein [Terriglobales bacterium]
MSEAARDLHERQEFWRPAMDASRTREAERVLSARAEACADCGTEFAPGARFCHACGAQRPAEVPRGARSASGFSLSRYFDFEQIRSGLGLSTASLIFFFAGLICAVAAIATGIVFSATTLLDWQAVQLWRIEWMLAAIVAFVAGLLLKK